MTPEEQAALHPTEVEIAQAYLRLLKRLEADPAEARKIPPIVKTYTNEQIDRLAAPDLRALQAMNAMPVWDTMPIQADELEFARAYIGALRRLKASPQEYAAVPAILRLLTDIEITNLDESNLKALRAMKALPAQKNDQPTRADLDQALSELVSQDPELQRVLRSGNPAMFASHPKIVAWLNLHPEFKRMIDEEVAGKLASFNPHPRFTADATYYSGMMKGKSRGWSFPSRISPSRA